MGKKTIKGQKGLAKRLKKTWDEITGNTDKVIESISTRDPIIMSD